MAERRRTSQMSDEELERALREIAPLVDYPPTPDLALAVRERLSARAPRSWIDRLREWQPIRVRPLGRSLALAIVALLLVVGAAVAIQFGLRGLPIVFVSSLPPAVTSQPAIGQPTASGPAAVGATLGLGELSTLEGARRQVDFPVALPTLPDLARPDAVYLGRPPQGGRVELVYRARAGLTAVSGSDIGLLITQFRGRTRPELVKKVVGPGTRVEFVPVAGGEGYWITGDPHVLLYETDRGDVQEERSRLVADVLIWEREGVVYRIESALPQESVVRIAESVR